MQTGWLTLPHCVNIYIYIVVCETIKTTSVFATLKLIPMTTFTYQLNSVLLFNVNSNNPPKVLKALRETISTRINKISSNK